MIMIFISLILLGLTALYIYYFILNDHRRHIIKKINGPKSFPFIGSSYYFLRQNYEGNNKEIFKKLTITNINALIAIIYLIIIQYLE